MVHLEVNVFGLKDRDTLRCGDGNDTLYSVPRNDTLIARGARQNTLNVGNDLPKISWTMSVLIQEPIMIESSI